MLGARLRAEVARIAATAACLYEALDGTPSGGAPGSIGRPFRDGASANPRTRPHWLPSKLWTLAGTAASPCAAFFPSASGCQNVASWAVEPGWVTTSGAFIGV